MAKHKTIRLKPKAGRRAKAGAPWIFSNEIDMSADVKALPPGMLVNVAGDDRVLGTGYFNPHSLIAVRLLDAEKYAAIGRDFFAAKLQRALKLREALYDGPYYRLVHAEGDGLPGLTIDRFDDVCVAQVTTAGMEALTDTLLEALDEVIAPRAVVLRNDARWKGWIASSAPDAAKFPPASPSRKTARAISATCRAARRPAGITTSAITAPSWQSWRRAKAF